jgi:2-(1,2-epoxy-1,2-dihydrophenyl)acetyl-CoA isomerase
LLPRIIGLHKAKELMFTADLLDAPTALAYGLVNKVLNAEALKEETYTFAERLANAAPLAIGYMKKIINRSDTLSLDAVLDYEADLQAICMQTEDHREGVAAFKEKRTPIFTGR